MSSGSDSLNFVIDSLKQTISRYGDESALAERITWFILIPFTIAFAFIIFVVYRSRREASFRQKEAGLQQMINEVEMKALRSQLNPHFIFNCLNSIYLFVKNNNNTSAENYLLKFSKLMRLVLENSLHHEVPLKDDLHALMLYIDMERMRMNEGFEYSVDVAGDIDQDRVLVPPLIVQPFVENSIWHGVNNRTDGRIHISVMRSEGMLNYTVEDNGNKEFTTVDETENREIKKKSLGMSLTSERLELLNRSKKSNAHFIIRDKTDADGSYSGRKVELMLPYEEDN